MGTFSSLGKLDLRFRDLEDQSVRRGEAPHEVRQLAGRGVVNLNRQVGRINSGILLCV